MAAEPRGDDGAARRAALHGYSGDYAAAEAGFTRAETLLEDLVHRDGTRVLFREDLAVTRARHLMAHLGRGDTRAAKNAWLRVGGPVDGGSPARQVEVLLAGVAAAQANGDAATAQALRAQAEALFAAKPLNASTDPEAAALRARFLIASGRREEAAPLIARLDAIGYRHPDYERSARGQ